MSSFREQRYNKLFKLLREEVYKHLCNIRRDEDIKGVSCNLIEPTRYYATMFYFMIIYNDITNPYSEILTWEEYREKYNYTDLAECVRCHNINFNSISSELMFEELIAADGVDTQLLIDAVADNNSITTYC